MRWLLILTLLPMVALAQWDGYPVATASTNYLTWQEYDAAYGEHPFSQLVSALHERQTVAGLSLLSIAHSTDVGQAANPIAVTVTNTWGWFTNSGNVCYENMTHQDIVDFDVALAAAVRYFCDTNYAATNMIFPIPMWTMTNVFLDHGIGHVRGSTAEFTRQPSSVVEWVLAETVYGTNWTTKDIDDFASTYYASHRPVLWYNPADTQQVGVATITGTILYQPGQTVSAGIEVVAVSGEYTSLTSVWYDVTNVAYSVTGNTGDVLQVKYTNAIAIYSGQPYDLSHELFDERYTVLNALVATETHSSVSKRTRSTWYGAYTDQTPWGTGPQTWRAQTNVVTMPYNYVTNALLDTFWPQMVQGASNYFDAVVITGMTKNIGHTCLYELQSWASFHAYRQTNVPNDVGYVTLQGYAANWLVANGAVTTNFAHDLELFARTDAGDASADEFYDFWGYGVTNGEWFYVTNARAVTAAVTTNDIWIESNLSIPFPGSIASNPTPATKLWYELAGTYGQAILDSRWRVWWNVTNGGFKYK